MLAWRIMITAGPGPPSSSPIDLEAQPEQHPDPAEVASRPVHAQRVQPPGPPQRALAERPAREQPDAEQRREGSHLPEQKPPGECHQANTHPWLAVAHPEGEVDDRGAEQEDGEQDGHEDERQDLERDPANPAQQAGPERAVVSEQRPLGGHPDAHALIFRS